MNNEELSLEPREEAMKAASVNHSKKIDYDTIIAEVEAKRKAAFMKCIPLLVLGLLIAIVGGIVYGRIEPTAIIFCVGIGVVVIIISFSVPVAIFQNYFKKHFCELLVRSVYEDASYEAKPVINGREIKKLEMFMVDNLQCEDMIRASYKGVNFSAVDMSSYTVTTNGKNNTTTITHFDGLLLRYDFNKPFEGMIRIVEKEAALFPTGTGGLKKVKVESIEFNNNYNLYASSEAIAFYVLTPQVIMGLLDLRKTIKGAITIRITANSIYFAVGGAKNHLEPPLFKKFGREELVKMSKGLEPMKVFVDLLNLDDRHFVEVNQIKKKTAQVK